MSQALNAGASGLLAHQVKLDIVANNLANLNTTAYKSQRVLFSDLLYTTSQPASAASGNVLGGTNPQQTGFGVGIAQTFRDAVQGVLTPTGSELDFAIQGDGFFVVDNGSPSYTRAGSFSLDSQGSLVDPSTGALVQRYGPIGEGLDGNPAFQTTGDNSIKIPLGAGIGGKATTTTAFLGNLPATATGPRQDVLQSSNPLLTAGSPASLSTLLNDLDTNVTPYSAGDVIELDGFASDGSVINITMPVDGTSTVGDLVSLINSVLPAAMASLDAGGRIAITADDVGESKTGIKLADADANTGGTEFADHLLLRTVDGKLGDTFSTTMQVFDSRGAVHAVNAIFQKVDENSWDASFDLIDGSGTVTDNTVRRIEFAEDGSFLATRGTGIDDADIELNFDSLSVDQTIAISMDGLAHLATGFTTSYQQDGFPPGNLVSVSVNGEGILQGVATNGQRIPIAQLAVATFINVQGLEAQGQNYYMETANSGLAQVGPGLTGGAGAVSSGQLESSNVDVALEFTQLIVAQRGFSANARTITVASEVMEEMANIVR